MSERGREQRRRNRLRHGFYTRRDSFVATWAARRQAVVMRSGRTEPVVVLRAARDLIADSEH